MQTTSRPKSWAACEEWSVVIKCELPARSCLGRSPGEPSCAAWERLRTDFSVCGGANLLRSASTGMPRSNEASLPFSSDGQTKFCCYLRRRSGTFGIGDCRCAALWREHTASHRPSTNRLPVRGCAGLLFLDLKQGNECGLNDSCQRRRLPSLMEH